MRALSNNVFKITLLVIVLGQLSGCVSIVKSAVLSTFPTFETTEQTWPALSNEKGRVVIYWPARTTEELLLFGGTLAAAEVGIDEDESKLGKIGNETFVFVDLTLGQHKINFIHPGPFFTSNKVAISVDVRAGEVIYVKVNQSYTGWDAPDPPVIVGAAEARKALTKIHHNYKDTVPFTQQRKGVRSAL